MAVPGQVLITGTMVTRVRFSRLTRSSSPFGETSWKFEQHRILGRFITTATFERATQHMSIECPTYPPEW